LTKALLADAIDIPAWLEQDRHNAWRTRIRRDRKIVDQTDLTPKQETRRVLHWWSQVEPQSQPQNKQGIDENSSGQVLASIFKRVSWIALIIGFIAGIVLAASLLHYDGAQPINVLVLLIVLVLIPLLLFLLSLLIPMFSSSSLMSSLNVGNQLFAFIKRKNPVLQEFFSTSRSDSTRDAVLRWKLLLSSQQFGIALAVAALLTLLAKVSFSDLAFGWSTTLDFQSSSLTPWIQALATPWATWLPEAVPSNQLIEQSRFYRLEDGVRELSAEALTGWWKFIAMCLLVYGIGFRLLAAWLASMKYKTATEDMLMQHSEVTALLERFNAPTNLHDDAPVVTAENNSINDTENTSPKFNFQSVDIVILWNRVNLFDNDLQHENVIELTSGDILQLDNGLFKEFDKNSIKKIHIITKAWEPPLLEFHDLIVTLRKRFGSQTIISVQPIAEDKHTPKKIDVEIWRHSLEKLQDPKVYVL
jgi:hypothetical protein